MATREQVNQLASAMSGASALASSELRDVFELALASDVETGRKIIADAYPLIADKYGEMAGEVAASWYEQMREQSGIKGSFRAEIGDKYEPEAVAARAWSATSHMEKGDTEAALKALENSLDRYVKHTGRQTIVKNAAKDKAKPRFARVPTGATTCGFCLILASRGAVYHTEETAGTLMQYHGHCDCAIVPIWPGDPYPEGYDPEALYADYLANR